MSMLTANVPAPAGDAAELDRLGDEIAELSAHLDAATARLLDLIREFDARGGWGNGFRSCAHWLSWRVGLDIGAAREKVRVARALATLPRLAHALARGELSYAKVRALTRVATPQTEERLLGVGRAGTAEHVERIVRGWRRVDRNAETREAATRHRSRALHVYRDHDGMYRLRGRLEPEVGELLIQALTAAREKLYERTRRTFVADPADVSAETRIVENGGRANARQRASHDGAAAGRRACPTRRDSPPPRHQSRRTGRALPGGGPRRRSGARRPRPAWPVRARERRTRFRGNVPPSGLRRQPRGDAARQRRPGS